MRPILIVILCWLGLSTAVWAKGPREASTNREMILLWSADTIIGPVYYPANEPTDSPIRQVAEDFARILGLSANCDWPVMAEPDGEIISDGIFIGETIRARLDGVYGTSDRRPATGQTRRELLDSDSWDRIEILASKRRLVINGITSEATRSGSYRFLQEAVGCIWVQPGEAGEIIPQHLRFALSTGRRVLQPDYFDRKFLFGRNLNPDDPDSLWALRLGASSHFDFNHHLFRIFTPAVMTEHEDWRAFRFGGRVPLSDVKASGSQPDLLNPEVVQYAADYVSERTRNDPNLLTIPLSTNDSIRYDDSVNTRELLMPWTYFRSKPNFSNLVFGFTNDVTEINSIDIDNLPYLTQLAYMWAEQPPDFKVSARVMPYICTDQSQWYDPNFRREDQALFSDWSDAGPRMLGAWEYYQGQPFLIPRHFPAIMADSLSWIWYHRGRGVFFSGRPVWGFDGPKFWLAGQLAWQVDTDFHELMNGYFQSAYGKAAEPMAAFFNACEMAWMEQPGEGMWLKYWNNPDQFALFPLSLRKQMNSRLEEAAYLASTIRDPAERTRVQTLVTQTQETWAVTEAGAELYEAWRALPFPSEKSMPPPDKLLFDFTLSRSIWLKTPKDVFPHAQDFIGRMDRLNPAARWSTGWESVSREDFQSAIFEGDLLGAGPETINPDRFLRGWATIASHAENLHVKRMDQPEAFLQVSGADFFTMSRWVKIQSGVQGEFRMDVSLRGVVSPGSQVEISLKFMDDAKNLSSIILSDRLYPDEFPDVIQLAVEAKLPSGMTHVCTTVRISNQFEADWIEIYQVDLQYRQDTTDDEEIDE